MGLVAVSLLGALACVRDNTADSAAGGPQPAGPPPLVLTSDAPWAPRYASDPTWSRAAARDDFALARLAGREGAEALLAAVGEGGSLGRVALAALPFAPDRHAARGGLCALLPRVDAASRSLLLAALFDVVIGAPMTDDSVDPGADAICARELDTAARLEPQPPIDRDRALAVRGRLRSP